MAQLVRYRHTNSKRLQSIHRVVAIPLDTSPSTRDSPLVQPCHALQTYLNPCFFGVSSLFRHFSTSITYPCLYKEELVRNIQGRPLSASIQLLCSTKRSNWSKLHMLNLNRQHLRCMSNTSVSLKVDNDVVRFCVDNSTPKKTGDLREKRPPKKFKKSRKAKVNELKLYRLMAKKKMTSPNPEVRIRYRLEKAKRKEEWLIEKLRKFDHLKPQTEPYDPEILTEEEIFYLKRTGEKKKNYVPVGRRGVFGGVVLNMHLHWKRHETVKVICKPCKPGQVHEYADELARLSKGIVIDIKSNNTIIFYRGKNYVQPKVMSPMETLSKNKAMEKYTYEQSLEHTSQFIEKLEREMEEYHKHVERYKKNKEAVARESFDRN